MRFVSVVNVIFGVFALALPADAEISASLFYQYCQVPPSKQDEILCTAYVTGLIAGMMYGKNTLDNGRRYCLPIEIDYTQATLVIRRFIEAHPELLSTAVGKDIGATASMALALTFTFRK